MFSPASTRNGLLVARVMNCSWRIYKCRCGILVTAVAHFLIGRHPLGGPRGSEPPGGERIRWEALGWEPLRELNVIQVKFGQSLENQLPHLLVHLEIELEVLRQNNRGCTPSILVEVAEDGLQKLLLRGLGLKSSVLKSSNGRRGWRLRTWEVLGCGVSAGGPVSCFAALRHMAASPGLKSATRASFARHPTLVRILDRQWYVLCGDWYVDLELIGEV